MNIQHNTKAEDLALARALHAEAVTMSKKYDVGTEQHNICLMNIKKNASEIKRLSR